LDVVHTHDERDRWTEEREEEGRKGDAQKKRTEQQGLHRLAGVR